VHVEAGMSHQPALDGRPLVGGGVLHDQLHVQLAGHGLVDAGQELRELDRAVPRGHLGNHLAACHLQRRVQVGGAMAGVVVAAAPATPASSGKTGAVRSSAWRPDFSSAHSTTAASGGFNSSPTTSRTLSMNCGSVDSFQASSRWA
jgi:hypothetical protein